MFLYNLRSQRNLAIDLGNSNTLLTDQNSILLSQPSCLVINQNNNKIEAVGGEAFEMFEKTTADLKSIKPLRGGVIADGESAKKMLHSMVNRIQAKSMFPSGYNYLVSGVPYDTTEVERRALRDALDQFHSRNTRLVYEPLAAALGMDLNIQEPEGKLIVDIGGGITEIVVISLSGIAAFQSIKVAGDTFDEDIQDHFRRNYNMSIGLKTAEQIKINVGAVSLEKQTPSLSMKVRGKDLIEGIPVSRMITDREVAEVLNKSFSLIEGSIQQTLEVCPPELAADIYKSGIHLTGGNALLRGIQQRLSDKFKLPVHIDDHALLSVSKGTAQIINNPLKYKSVLFQ
jgi:rod shape-determining protein MreB and related proteins